jgi:histone acetyltransferase (RNA polymerase elongator complex component)
LKRYFADIIGLLKKITGDSMKKEYIVPIFIPHAGCSRICSFCNEFSATGLSSPPDKDGLEREFQKFVNWFQKKDSVYISFYGSTFTALTEGKMRFYLDWAQSKVNSGQALGIRFSTSPHEITPEKLDILSRYKIDLIELGVQSFFDDVLLAANRPHDAEDVYTAMALLDQVKIPYGLHIMTGLKESSFHKDILSGFIACCTNAVTLRVHPSVVLKGSMLEQQYRQGLYTPETLEIAVEKCAIISIYAQKMEKKIIRLGLCVYGKEKENIVAGPYHDSFGSIVKSRIARFILTTVDFSQLEVPMKYKPDFIGLSRSNLKYLDSRISFKERPDFLLDGKELSYNELLFRIKNIY